jgi:hypothetical protein
MRISSAVALIALAAILAGCAAPAARDAAPVVLDRHNFEYSVASREDVQLVQVFDDGSKTYLQFTHAPAEPVVIDSGTESKPLLYTGDGPYLIVSGVYVRLAVSVGAHSTVVTNDAPVVHVSPALASDPGTAAGTSMPPTPNPEAQLPAPGSEALPLRAVDMDARIDELRAELRQAHAAGRASMVHIGTGGASPSVIIRFVAHSSAVEIDEELLRALGGSAMGAKHIYLHVSTDTDALIGPSADLAAARAVAVEHLLISQGVEAQRIRILYRAVDGDGASNVKQDGKAGRPRPGEWRFS